MSDSLDPLGYCTALGLSPRKLLSLANDEARAIIKSAFRRKSREIHPDHNPDIDKTVAQEKLVELIAARDLLLDEKLRRNYLNSHITGKPQNVVDTEFEKIFEQMREEAMNDPGLDAFFEQKQKEATERIAGYKAEAFDHIRQQLRESPYSLPRILASNNHGTRLVEELFEVDPDFHAEILDTLNRMTDPTSFRNRFDRFLEKYFGVPPVDYGLGDFQRDIPR